MNSAGHKHIIRPSLSGSDATVTSPSRSPQSAIPMASQIAGLAIDAADLDVITLSAQFDEACNVAQLVVQITETSDDELHIHGSALDVFEESSYIIALVLHAWLEWFTSAWAYAAGAIAEVASPALITVLKISSVAFPALLSESS